MMDIEDEIKRFKMQLLRKMPFYGDIVMRLPIVRNDSIPTARTNGRNIEYNAKFLGRMTPGQRNFVIMHEIFHVLLFHCDRRNERRPQVWNTAADMVVNSMLVNMQYDMNCANIEFARPKDGIFTYIGSTETVENIYAKLMAINGDIKKYSDKIKIFRFYLDVDQLCTIKAPDDIILIPEGIDGASGRGSSPGCEENGMLQKGLGENSEDDGLSRQAIFQMIMDSASKNRSNMNSYFVPRQVLGLVGTKKIRWDILLRDFLMDDVYEEVSYATPERKYIHMGLIIPGYGSREEKIEEIWAFVDSSGSIGIDEMSKFLTQLYRISKEFKCIFNICYWDTAVTDVYKKIDNKEDILKSLPHHSGGTNINCIYDWIKKNRIKPDVMLVLTDGYFGSLDKGVFIPTLAKKTILVLSGNIRENDEMRKIGKIARIE